MITFNDIMRNKHSSLETMDQMTSSTTMAFKHPFSMVVSGPSGSGKSVWTKKLLLSSLIQPSPELIIWCFGQWQSLYDNIRKRIPTIEFVNGIPDHLNDQHYIDETLPEIHKMARGLLREQLVSIYYLEKCPLYTSLMNTAERLHRNSHLSVPLAITEAIRLYKPELNKVLVDQTFKGKVKMTSPVTPETEMVQGPDDPCQKTETAMMEGLSDSE